MLIFVIAAVLVPIVDQAVKRSVRSRVAARRISLGAIGDVRVVPARIRMTRTLRPVSLRGMWAIWVTGATASAAMSAIVPDAAWAFWTPRRRRPQPRA